MSDWHPARLTERLDPDRQAGEPMGCRAAERAERILARLAPGDEWALDAPAQIPAVWGEGDDVLWSEGEPLMIAAPPGVGKTSLAQQLALHRAGLRTGRLLGLPVRAGQGRVLYVAADRPAQAARSLKRMVTAHDRPGLRERLIVWRGPLDFTLADPDNANRLASLAGDCEATTIVLDSLGNLAVGLADDAVGAAVNAALQECVAEGLEVLALHHNRKATDGNRRPRALDDIYGSRWITAGAGSVIALWAQDAGAAIVELAHVKQPAGEVGPLTLLHDHLAGKTRVIDQVTVLDALTAAGQDGATVRDVAAATEQAGEPDRAQLQKARRRLRALVDEGRAELLDGTDPPRYRRTLPEGRVPRVPSRVPPQRTGHAGHEPPGNTRHAQGTRATSPGMAPAPPFKGGRAPQRAPDRALSSDDSPALPDAAEPLPLATPEQEAAIARAQSLDAQPGR